MPDDGQNLSARLPPPETFEVTGTRVACDGGDGALGHPKVYLEMGEENFIDCPYCDRRFKLKAGAERDITH